MDALLIPRNDLALTELPDALDCSHLIPAKAWFVFGTATIDPFEVEYSLDDCHAMVDEGNWLSCSYPDTGLVATIVMMEGTYFLDRYVGDSCQTSSYPFTQSGWQSLVEHSQLNLRDDWTFDTVSAKEAEVDEDWQRISELLRSIREDYQPFVKSDSKRPVWAIALNKIQLMPLRVVAGIRWLFTSDFRISNYSPPIPTWRS